jgi:hypothetical protein
VTDRRAHVKVSRRFFDSADWREPRKFSRAEAWLDCIQLAAWKPRRYAIGLEVQELQRGEFMASVRFLGERWGWSKSAIQRWLLAAQQAGRLAVRREGQGGTVYVLVNYEAYQGDGEPKWDTDRDTLRDTSGTPAGHLRDKTEAVKASKAVKATWLTPFADTWKARCGEPPFGKLATALRPLVKQHAEVEVLVRWRRYLDATDPQFASPHRFAQTWHKWAVPETQEMADDFGRMVPHRKNEAGAWVPVVSIA